METNPAKRRSVAVEIAHTLGFYAKGQAAIAGILMLVYSAGYALAGVPYWLAVGILSGALHMIPVAGALIALALPALAVLASGASPYRLLGALAVYLIAQGLEGFYLTPRMLGSRLRLPPVAVFVAVLAGGALFGFLGLLLAVPVLAVAAVVWRRSLTRSDEAR
jgi:predicted PurR-regulated permease PerM